MSKNDDYKAGYQDGRQNSIRNSGNRDYDYGYNRGKQEYDFWNDKNLYPSLRHDETKNEQYHSTSTNDVSTLTAMVGGSIILALLWWCLAGLLLFLLWITGSSESFWFQLIFQISLWGSISFVVLMSIAGVVMAIIETIEKHSN